LEAEYLFNKSKDETTKRLSLKHGSSYKTRDRN
jgi:hypothetical protein